ncbi:amidohydrolase family protein [Prevotella cerevisiae]|uniref:Amidohydrolase family protein n=1 Tax=Segatella cerevisiae TaxID=2053716 RepID=A0ABT1C0H4_9BACT|nr:amidohydrolase family protein [Segatella cerevisiae]MCO6026465.1 amidohydrolase family protein [Segatella cerevisiae]
MKNLIIDGHSHVTFPVEKHLACMDEAGIDKTVLFRTSIHPESQSTEAGVKVEMHRLMDLLSGDPAIVREHAKKASEELFDVVERYSDRFYCFGMVQPDMDFDEMKEMVEGQIAQHHILGLGEFTLASGTLPSMENVFKVSAQTACLPLWIHCFNPLVLEDIRQIEVLARKYPSVPVIIGHSGGSNWMETIDIVKRNPNMFIDVSATFSSMVLKIIIQELPDKTFFGVDYPYGDMWIMRKMVERVCPDKVTLGKVMGGNITRLLKL